MANNLLISLSGSSQTTPTWWLNPSTGVSYAIAKQTPQHRVASLQSDLGNIPVTSGNAGRSQTLQSLATVTREPGTQVSSHYNVTPVIDIYGAVQGRDLGAVAREINPILAASEKQLPRGSQIIVRGQIETMTSSFRGLLVGLALAILLVYLLIVVNFQSWLDPLIIITALPAALAGIVWILFLTHTTISVPSLTGVADSCARRSGDREQHPGGQLREGRARWAAPRRLDAAIAAGFYAALRPVLMTALAMIIGMVPMALGFGEGGEQNAPLGRAVIGGLAFATVATLFFVPSVFAAFHRTKAHGSTDAPIPAAEINH